MFIKLGILGHEDIPMWITEKTRRAHVTPRPFRIAYLVPHAPDHALLDAVFDESMSRWGGRRTPILKTDGARISDDDWRFLDLWDADLIYSYVPLTDELRDRIAFCMAPSAIETHKEVAAGADKYDFRPTSQQLEWALKSISVLPRMARQQDIRKGLKYEVLDKERGSHVARDLADSFGFMSNSTNDLSLMPYARRLSYRDSEHENHAPRFPGDDVISYVSDFDELESRLSKDTGLLFPSHMSDMFCPYLNVLGGYRVDWEEQLTIVVGDETDDRLLYWNSIHHYHSLDSFRGLQILRFASERFRNGVPDWIKHLCSAERNRRHLTGNGASNVKIISASLGETQLEEISNAIGQGHTMSSFERFAASDVIGRLVKKDPRKEYKLSLNLWPAWNWSEFKVTEAVRLEKNELDLPCIKPWHLSDFPLGPTTVGGWLNDLSVERLEDHSKFQNVVHRWMFPRRLALHRAINIENYGKTRFNLVPPFRPSERGDLSLWDDPQWQRPTLQFPQDIEAFHQALHLHHPNTAAEHLSYGRGGPIARIADVRLSDKGRDLLGVLKFFRNLNEALNFLTNPYILSIISRLSPVDPGKSKRRILTLRKDIKKMLQGVELNDQNVERVAKRALELAARGVLKDTRANGFANYKWLFQNLAETGTDANRQQLDECLKILRNENFLLQGYGWRCVRCQHPNWVGLADLTSLLSCAICNSTEDAPVGGDDNFHFKINPFVSAAFAPTSAQGSVIWCLSLLFDRAQHSLLMTPTLDIKDENTVPRGTDLDVFACVDGKVHLYEVKKSFAGIDQKQIDDLVLVASLIRPDYAGFAVEDDANKEALSEESIQLLRERLETIDVKFVLLTKAQDSKEVGYAGVPANIGDTMEWSVW